MDSIIHTVGEERRIPCRYCGDELSLPAPPGPQPLQIPCKRCGYITVSEESTFTVPLEDVLFRSPFFFDFGVRAALPLPERDALLNSTGGNWSVYYPFCSIWEEDGHTVYVATSRGTMVGFLTMLNEYKNSLHEEMIATAKEQRNVTLSDSLSLSLWRGFVNLVGARPFPFLTLPVLITRGRRRSGCRWLSR
jgi:hypothetical protein